MTRHTRKQLYNKTKPHKNRTCTLKCTCSESKILTCVFCFVISSSSHRLVFEISYQQLSDGYHCKDILLDCQAQILQFLQDVCYFSHPRQSSGNHAPKCLPFSILCAKSVIIRTSVTHKLIKTGIGVNCNRCVTYFSTVPNHIDIFLHV